MAITIDNAFIEEYRDLVIHLSQQSVNRLRPYVTEVSSRGVAYNFDRLAATEAAQKTGRRVDTPYIDDTWSRRVAAPTTWNHTLTVEHEDKVQMLVDPESAYAENQAMAMRRQWDRLLVTAATGTALDADDGAQTFPAGQVVGDGTTVISFDMVTEVQEIFMANNIDMDVPKVMVVGPTQVRKLLQLTEQTSSDFVQREALQRLSSSGIVPQWMGFTWLVSTLLDVPSATQLSCLAFTKRALGLAINQDVFVRIGENPAKSYMIQVYAQFTGGAVRIEDEHIVHMHVKDAIS